MVHSSQNVAFSAVFSTCLRDVSSFTTTFYWIQSMGGRVSPWETHGHNEDHLVTFVFQSRKVRSLKLQVMWLKQS